MTLARSEHPAVILEDEVVVAGGFIEVGVGRTGVTPTVEAYSPDSDTWRDLPDLPEARHHGMAAVVGGRAFFIGGYAPSGDPSTSVWELIDDAWVDRAPLPEPGAAGAAVVLGQAIHVLGGAPGALFLHYDAEGDSWSRLPEPAREREHVASVVVDGEVWAIAGRWEGEIFATTEIFDPETQTWRNGPTLGEPRSGFGAAVVDGAIVVAGGEVFSPDQALTSVEMLEPGDDQWATIEPLPHGLHGNPLVAVETAVYLPGGSLRAAAVDNDGLTYRLLPR
jgi:N-acetylneuraminic acid mutarotase